jgi:hypothetical protein
MMKCNIPHAPSTGFGGTQFSTLKIVGNNAPEQKKNKKKKNNNSEVKDEAVVFSCHTALDSCCCDVKSC